MLTVKSDTRRLVLEIEPVELKPFNWVLHSIEFVASGTDRLARGFGATGDKAPDHLLPDVMRIAVDMLDKHPEQLGWWSPNAERNAARRWTVISSFLGGLGGETSIEHIYAETATEAAQKVMVDYDGLLNVVAVLQGHHTQHHPELVQSAE